MRYQRGSQFYGWISLTVAQSQSMDCLPLWYLIIFLPRELSSLYFVYSHLFHYLLYLFNALGNFWA